MCVCGGVPCRAVTQNSDGKMLPSWRWSLSGSEEADSETGSCCQSERHEEQAKEGQSPFSSHPAVQSPSSTPY